MKRLLLTPLIFALSSPAYSGIPEYLNSNKWMKINESWIIDTEDVELKGNQLRFYVERQASKDEIGNRDYLMSYVGKLRLRCSDFSSKIQVRIENPPFGSYYGRGAWEKIRPDMMAYTLANYLCFLSRSKGYTRETKEPRWAAKIIQTVQTKSIRYSSSEFNINCDSPVHANKPDCMDY